jgi:hypothetical protein
MKKTLFFLFSVCTLCASAQWQILGQRNFSSGDVSSINLEINNVGVPYVAFQDMANGGKVSVMKFDGTNWVYVGAPNFSSASANQLHFTISAADTLYVAYSNGSDSLVYAKKFDGTNWQQIGNPVMKSIYADIAVDINNVPNVAVVTGKDGYGGPDTVYVKKFIAGNWVKVGNTMAARDASIPEIEMDNAGYIYLAASSRGLNYGTLFYVYNNISWQQAGGLAYQEYIRLRAGNGQVYIINHGVNAPHYYGTPNLVDFKTGAVLYTFYTAYDVAIDTSSKPYYLFGGSPYCGPACSMMSYALVGGSSATIQTNFGTYGECKMSIDNGTGSLRGSGYIAFMDTASIGPHKLSVISSSNPSALSVHALKSPEGNISIFPNPANSVINLKSDKEIGLVTIYNSFGEIVFQNKISSTQTQLDISKFPNGIYNVKTQTGALKIIKE